MDILKKTGNGAIGIGKKILDKRPSLFLPKPAIFEREGNVFLSPAMEKAKHRAIVFFSGLDYDLIIKQMSKLRYLDPRLAIAVLVIEKVKVGFDYYNRSKSDEKELKLSEQLLSIGKEFRLSDVIDIVLPYSKKLPYGKAVVVGLRLLSFFTSLSEKKSKPRNKK